MQYSWTQLVAPTARRSHVSQSEHFSEGPLDARSPPHVHRSCRMPCGSTNGRFSNTVGVCPVIRRNPAVWRHVLYFLAAASVRNLPRCLLAWWAPDRVLARMFPRRRVLAMCAYLTLVPALVAQEEATTPKWGSRGNSNSSKAVAGPLRAARLHVRALRLLARLPAVRSVLALLG